MEKANYTKLVNLVIGKTSSAAEEKLTNLQRRLKTILPTNNNSNNHKDISHHNDKTKTTTYYHQTAKTKVVTTVKFQDIGKETAKNYKETNKTRQNNYYQPVLQQQYQQSLPIQQYLQLLTQQYQIPQRPNYYHTQSSYLTIPEKSDFQQTALSKDEAAAPKLNSFNNTILSVQIAYNANFLNIFPFEFEANESPFLFSNTAVNEQKAITAMYTKAEVEEKQIQLILNSKSAGIIVIVNEMKKTPVGEIDNFSFTINGITIPVKVLVIDTPQYQALVRNNWLLKANANLDWKTQELKILYQKQYTKVLITCGTFNKKSEKAPVFEFKEEKELLITKTFMALKSPSNWAKKTEQKLFEETRG
ncbi:hypothetical protein G9A89_015923 [Geosiphon pyriformis]|nr:hypothetical protein G9A89_015923 [Geosiphon pyriformis]